MKRASVVIAMAGLALAVHGASVAQAAPGGVNGQATATAKAVRNLENDVAQGTVTNTPTPIPTPRPVAPTVVPIPTVFIEATPIPRDTPQISRWQPAYLWTDADGNLMVNLGDEQIPVVAYGECDGVIPDTNVLAWRMDAGEAINTAYVMWDLLMISGQYNCVLQIHDYAPQAVAVEPAPTDAPAVAYVPFAQPQTVYVQGPAEIRYITPVPAEPTYTSVPTATPSPTATLTNTPTATPTQTNTPTITPTAMATRMAAATIVLPDESPLLPPAEEPEVVAEVEPPAAPRPPPITGSGHGWPPGGILSIADANEYPGQPLANWIRRFKVQV